MANLALNRLIEEDLNRAEVVTDGYTRPYTGGSGFCEFHWPGYLTLDLGERRTLRCIRFLLWDGLGEGKGVRDTRRYGYRVLISEDHATWRVIHDTQTEGYNGWQALVLANGLSARYVRIHGLWNSRNESFHIVELEVHDDVPQDPPEEVTFKVTVHDAGISTELGDGLSIEQNFRTLVKRLKGIIDQHSDIIKPEPIRELIGQLEAPVRDMTGIERTVDGIRRQIIDPVRRELQSMSRIGNWSFVVGVIGGILAIISILISIIN